MSLSIPDFWKLAGQSRLLSAEECQRLGAAFSAASPGIVDAASLSQWLVQQRQITPFHAKVLLAGRPGPFLYGDYKVLDRIEKGRLSGLFRAVHQPTRQPVGLHFISAAVAADRDALARLAAQTAAAGKLRHPLLWTCYQLVDLGAYKFVVVERSDGQSLEELLASKKPLPPVEACRVARFTAQALAELHKAGLTHGDIRPANIWLDAAGQVKLLCAPFVPHPQPRASWPAERLAAAADYLAPEFWRGGQAADEGPADAGADVYALGCTLYQMLSGQAPFAGGDAAQKQKRHVEEAPAPLDKVNNTVPRALAQVVEHMLAKEPGQRYQQASNIIDSLSPYVPPAKAALPSPPQTAESQAFEQHLRQPRAAAAAPLAAPAAAPPMAQPVGGPPRATAVSAMPAAGGMPMAVAVPVSGGNGHAMPVAQAVSLAGAAQPIGQPLMAAPVAAAAMPMAVAPQAVPLGNPAAFAAPAPAPAAYAAPPEFPAAVAAVPASVGVSTSRRLNAKRKRSNQILMLSAVGVLVIGGVGLALVWPKGGPKPPSDGQTPDGTQIASVANTSQTPADETVPDKPKKKKKKDGETDGDGATTTPPDPNAESLQTLEDPVWSSPTRGQPLSLAYFPPEVQAYLALRPAEILKHPEGEKILKGLGPLGELALTSLKGMSGLPPEEIEQAVFGFIDAGASSPPKAALVVYSAKSLEVEELSTEWGNPNEQSDAGLKLYRGPQYSYYLPAEGKEKVLVVCPFGESEGDKVKDWLEAAKGKPMLLSQIEQLQRTSDADRHLSLLVLPDFFLKLNGKNIFTGPAERMKDPLFSFLMDSNGLPRAALFSAHLTADDLFLEFRALGAPSEEPLMLAKTYRERIGSFENAFLDYSLRLNPHDYGKKLLAHFPKMLDQLGTQSRAAADPKQAIVRCYLPARAAHNLALATQLAVLEAPGAGSVAVAAKPAGNVPAKLADKLKMKITLSFPRNTLEKCMELFGEEIGAPVEIVGGDLQLEGITKNQSFGLDEKDQPAVEILKKVMLRSNPDGKLVYVIKDKNGKETLFITTRAGAKKRGEAITPDQEK